LAPWKNITKGFLVKQTHALSVLWEAHPNDTRTKPRSIPAAFAFSPLDIDPATIRKRSRSGLCNNHWLMVLTGIIAATVVIFEVIPMTMIPIVSVAVRQQEEHIIHPPTINTKDEGEHNIAIPFYTVSSYLGRRNSTKQNSDAESYYISFRTSENIIKELKREATSKNIPLSILLNNVVKDHLTQTSTEKADFIAISQDFFRRMFGKIDETSLEDFGKELGPTVVSDYMAYFFPEINGHTIVMFLEKWFSHFQSYRHRIGEGNNKHTFTLNHNINMKFSIVLKVILEGLIEPIIKNKVIFEEATSNRITFTFDA
jgi:hypothetical protein